MIETPKFIACVGAFATTLRVAIDLDCNVRDRRIILVSDDDALYRLSGLNSIVWCDMAASSKQIAFMRALDASGKAEEVTVRKAKEMYAIMTMQQEKK